VLAPELAGAQCGRLVARVLQDAGGLRGHHQRQLLAGQAAKAPVDGLPREPKIPRDRGVGRAVGEGARDLPALERVDLLPQLAEPAQRSPGAGSTGNLGGEPRHPLFGWKHVSETRDGGRGRRVSAGIDPRPPAHR
jgi:hypothetical protein